MAKYDGIIIGAGPNGLTLGAYLAKAGLKVLLLEKRFEMGGGLCTEQVTIPGFLHNTHAVYHAMVDYAPIFNDLELYEKSDLKFIHPDVVMAMPFTDGKSICLYKDVEKSCESISHFSRKDANTYREIYYKFKAMTDEFLAPATYALAIPPLEQVAKLESTEIGKAIGELTEKTPREIVDEYFENERVRAMFLYIACMFGLDYDLGGVGYLVPLMINRATNYRLCVGGSHHIAHAISKIIYKNGGMIIGSQIIKRIIVENGIAKGVELNDGTVYEANKFIASSIDPIQTFVKYVGENNLRPDFVTRLKDYEWEWDSLFVGHMALDKPPQFKAAASSPDVNRAFIYILGYESEEALINHWQAIKRGELVDGGFNCCFPSMFDPKQARVGQHTGLFSQHAPYSLQDGGPEKWYDRNLREGYFARGLATLRKYAPNIDGDNILWTYVTTPLDIENKFADMVRGSIKQGAYTPLQMGYLRPNEECSQLRTPVGKLYLCGASAFPGGLVLFGGGYQAANVIADDLGIKRWWKEPEMVTKAREKGLL